MNPQLQPPSQFLKVDLKECTALIRVVVAVVFTVADTVTTTVADAFAVTHKTSKRITFNTKRTEIKYFYRNQSIDRL